MKKLYLALAACALCIFSAHAQSESVPRYKGFALGALAAGNYALGDYADVAKWNAGGALAAEITFPTNFSKADVGLSVEAGVAHVFPNTTSRLEKENDGSFYAGLWLRLPFSLGKQWFAFQPEVSYGGAVRLTERKSESGTNTYIDQAVRVRASLRYIPHGCPRLELVLAPQYTLSPEKDYLIHQAGCVAGAVWHFSQK